MSTRSSSGSWSGAGRAPPDIIDLDKFMRGAVRPLRNDQHVVRCGDKLVVDAGGVDRKPANLSATPAPQAPAPLAAPLPPPPLTAPSDSSEDRAPQHGKRYSHDSGLSDTSYARRKHRPHRRAVGGDNSGVRVPRTSAAGSSASLRAFRAVCERALLDQQAQIARVAQLCERLSERPAPPPPPPRRRSDRSVTDSSDVSSSSRSTRDARRKDKHRLAISLPVSSPRPGDTAPSPLTFHDRSTQTVSLSAFQRVSSSSDSSNPPNPGVSAQTDECKTYKIIMNKLDELNRLFAARARSPPPAHPALPAPPAGRRPASSGSVSVSDKLCSTEPFGEHLRDLHIAHNVVTIRGGPRYGACGSCGAAPQPAAVSARLSALRTATTCAHDIAPCDALPRIATDSVMQCESRAGTGTSGGDPRCGFDLDDPVHLYSQAKRLQAMSATTRRARSVEPSAKCFPRFEHDEHSERSHRSARADSRTRTRERPREGSLCSLCRGYWRSLTHYLAVQIFCCPDAAAAVN